MPYKPTLKQRYLVVGLLFFGVALAWLLHTGATVVGAQPETGSISLSEAERRLVAAQPAIDAYTDLDLPPYNFLQDGRQQGFIPDYLALIGQLTGLQIRLQPQAQSGTLRIAPPDERSGALRSRSSLTHRVTGLLVRKGTETLASLERLNSPDYTLAVVKGSMAEQILKAHYGKVGLLLTNSSLESIQKVDSGQVDAAIGVQAEFHYQLNHYLFENLISLPVTNNPLFPILPLHLELEGDHAALMQLLDRAIQVINAEQRLLELNSKWFGVAPKDFAVASRKLELTAAEQEYLQRKKRIQMCVDPDWMPLEAIRNGKHIGMTAEFMRYFADTLATPIRLVVTENWSQSIAYAKERRCDIFSLAMATPERELYMVFTQPYLRIPLVIATHRDNLFIPDVASVHGKRLGVVKDYAFGELLRAKYPFLQLVDVDSVQHGLDQVERGNLFGFVGTLTTVGYALQRQYPELKIAGKFDDNWELGIGVRNDEPLLKSALEKAIASLPQQTYQKIFNNWISVRYEQALDYTLLWQLLGGALALFAIMLYRQQLLKRHYQALKQVSQTDPLTLCANRMKLDEILEYQISHYARYQIPFSILLVDLDKFKAINDRYGHLTGDQVLTSFVKLAQTHIRASDTLGRWGGEEFLIICPNTGLDGACRLAEQLRERVAKHPFEGPDLVTVSIGVAEYHHESISRNRLVMQADEALYQAKTGGRNRVVSYRG